MTGPIVHHGQYARIDTKAASKEQIDRVYDAAEALDLCAHDAFSGEGLIFVCMRAKGSSACDGGRHGYASGIDITNTTTQGARGL